MNKKIITFFEKLKISHFKDGKLKHKIVTRFKKASTLILEYRKSSIAIFIFIVLYVVNHTSSQQLEVKNRLVVKHDKVISFKGGHVIASGQNIYKKKEQIIYSELKKLKKEIKLDREKQRRLFDLIKNLDIKMSSKKVLDSKINATKAVKDNELRKDQNINLSAPIDDARIEKYNYKNKYRNSVQIKAPKPFSGKSLSNERRRKRGKISGPAIISFPVEEKTNIGKLKVTIPTGSFVKATMLTGVEAPEGKALPVLLKADFAFVGPNKSKIDLSGCFFIGKSTGNLSIERVELQIVKMSCVSKSGRSFENEVRGFVADESDNSFAVIGSVNGKKNRVAALAFLSSIVEGVGKAVQQGQVTSTTNALGGNSSILSGSQAKHMYAGGATNAASRITNFYLKHAESLLPTINIGSGRQVFIILQEKVNMPNWFFRKVKKKEKNAFSYLSRVLD
jgi:hypothetical protein